MIANIGSTQLKDSISHNLLTQLINNKLLDKSFNGIAKFSNDDNVFVLNKQIFAYSTICNNLPADFDINK